MIDCSTLISVIDIVHAVSQVDWHFFLVHNIVFNIIMFNCKNI